MALSTCRDCNREVSTLARHCVHCGRPRPTGTGAGSVVAGIAAVAVALVLTGAVVCMAKRACHKMSTRASAQCREAGLIRCAPLKAETVVAPAADATLDDVRKSLEVRGLKVEQDGPNRLSVELAPKPAEERK